MLFFYESEAAHDDIMYFTEMRWLSRSNVLTRSFELELHVSEHDDSNGAMVLSHIFPMPNLLNQKLHGLNQVVTADFGRVNAFATTPKLWKAELSEKKHYPLPNMQDFYMRGCCFQ